MANRDIDKGMKYRKQPDGFDSHELSKMLDEAYKTLRRESGHRQKTTFSPSTVGYGHGNCPRYWVLAFRGGMFEEKADPLGIAAMASGTQAHERIERIFGATGLLVASEVELTMDDPPIRGFADVVINWNGQEIVGELKTTRQEMFDIRRTTMKPTPYHNVQLLMYLRAKGLKLGFIMYENKNTNEFLVIPVEMNEKNSEILEHVLDWLRTIRKAYLDGEVPKCVYQKRNKYCQGCPLFDACWGENAPNPTIEIPKLEIPKP